MILDYARGFGFSLLECLFIFNKKKRKMYHDVAQNYFMLAEWRVFP